MPRRLALHQMTLNDLKWPFLHYGTKWPVAYKYFVTSTTTSTKFNKIGADVPLRIYTDSHFCIARYLCSS